MRFCSTSALLVGACSLGALSWCSAEDTDWTPFLAVGYAPSVDRIDHADFTDKGSGTAALGAALRQTFQGAWGYVVTVEVFDAYGKADGDEQSVDGVSVKTNDLGLKVASGPTYDITRDWSIALEPYVSVGWERFAYSGGFGNNTDDGISMTYGAKLALHYAINHGFRVGIYGGWEGITARMKDQSTSTKYTATGNGPVAGLSFGWLF